MLLFQRLPRAVSVACLLRGERFYAAWGAVTIVYTAAGVQKMCLI